MNSAKPTANTSIGIKYLFESSSSSDFLELALTLSTSQSLSLHFRPSADFPSQDLPPCSGRGFVHARVRNWNPVPHVALHVVQFDHSENPPSTVYKKNAYQYKILKFEEGLLFDKAISHFVSVVFIVKYCNQLSYRLCGISLQPASARGL